MYKDKLYKPKTIENRIPNAALETGVQNLNIREEKVEIENRYK